MKPSADFLKFKEKEKQHRATLSKGKIYGMRFDGKAFHTFTRQFKAPYDKKFMKAMDDTAKFIMKHAFNSALFAYVQSDEITIFFTDLTGERTELPFAGKLEKILSVGASTASVGFLRSLPHVTGLPVFDARVFELENKEEVIEYVQWRREDARKNAISMAAEQLLSHKELMGMSTRERFNSLVGTPFEKLPDGFFNGRLIVSKDAQETVEYVHKKTGELHQIEVKRKKKTSIPATNENMLSLQCEM